MYYDEKEIAEHLKCPYCQDKLDDPRILPCGSSICCDCCIFLSKKITTIKCKICMSLHEIPAGGFTKNLNLAKVIELKPFVISRGKAITNFKATLDNLDDLTKEFETNLSKEYSRLIEKCSSDRIDVQLTRNLAHQKVDIYCDEFLHKIREFEQEGTKKFNQNTLDKSDLNSLIRETKSFNNKWQSFLKNLEIDESKINAASTEAQKRIKAIKRKANYLDYELFGAKLLKFEDNLNNISSKVIGTLKSRNVFYSEQLDSPSQFNFQFIHNDAQIEVEMLHENNFIVAHKNKDDNLNLVIVNSNGIIKNEVNSIVSSIWGKDTILEYPNTIHADLIVLKFKLMKIDEILYVFIEYKDVQLSEIIYEIQFYDSNLQLGGCWYLNNCVSSISMFENKIYMMWFKKSYNCTIVSVLDSTGKIENKFGQKCPCLPFYFANNIRQFEVNEQFYFLLDTNKIITLMNKSDGLVTKEFYINSDSFTLYLNKFFIGYDNEQKLLRSYDQNGELVSEEDGMLFTSNTKLIKAFGEQLIFYDNEEKIFSF